MYPGFDPTRPRSAVAGAVLLGVFAGLVAALFLIVTAEPAVEDAIAIEEANAGPDAPHEKAEVGRGTQRGAGLFGAYALTGGAFGLLFGVTFLAMRRSQPHPFRRALVTGTALAGALTLSPWIKYPPNPPAVGDPATLAERQWLYACLVCTSALVFLLAARLSGRLRAAGWVEDQRVVAVAVAVIIPLLAVYALLPPSPDPVTVPATLVWRFRVASLGGNLLLWTVLALGFGAAAAHRQRRSVGREGSHEALRVPVDLSRPREA